MAKLENLGPFLGSPLVDIDPGVPTFGRVLSNAQADVAGLLELSTDDTQAAHINHSGNGRGARMGIPWVCQTLDAGLSLDAVVGGAKNGGLVGGDIFEFHWLIVVPAGETEVLVDVRLASVGAAVSGEWRDLSRSLAPRVRLSSSTDVTTAAGDDLTLFLTGSVVNDDYYGQARFTGVAAGLALLTLQISSTPLAIVGVDILTRVADVIVRPARDGVPKMQPTPLSVSAANPIAPGASEALSHQVMDSAAFASANAISGWHTSRIDSNLNALEVYAGASPPPSGDYNDMPESALRNPTRDRYKAFTRKTFADEPIPVIPILSACLGGIKSGGGFLCNPAVAGSYNTRTGYAPFAFSSAMAALLGEFMCQMPDVPSSTSVIRWAALVGQSSAVGFADVRAILQISASAGTGSVAVTALTGASHLAIATGTALAFTRDAVPDSCRVRFSALSLSGGFTALDFCGLSVAVWVEE